MTPDNLEKKLLVQSKQQMITVSLANNKFTQIKGIR